MGKNKSSEKDSDYLGNFIRFNSFGTLKTETGPAAKRDI